MERIAAAVEADMVALLWHDGAQHVVGKGIAMMRIVKGAERSGQKEVL